jgi:hypothetical protein
MNKQDYEQKRAECWEEYCKTHPLCNTPVMRLNFDWIFDRAFALGKLQASDGQVKETISQEKETTTQQDYKSTELECWCDFCNTEIARKNSFDRALVKAANNFAFFRGYRFGKQKKNADTVISGWAARHGNGPNVSGLRIYTVKPKRIELLKMWDGHGEKSVLIDHRFFPDLTWESDPEPVEIIIKRKKNG